MISTKQYIDTYNAWCDHLQDAAVAISKSSECRKTLIKNTATADPLDLLQEAVECIYHLTGDRCFYKEVTEAIEGRRKNDKSE